MADDKVDMKALETVTKKVVNYKPSKDKKDKDKKDDRTVA